MIRARQKERQARRMWATAEARARRNAKGRSEDRPFRFGFNGKPGLHVVAVGPLTTLMALLRLDRQGRDRARLEALPRDRLAGLLRSEERRGGEGCVSTCRSTWGA